MGTACTDINLNFRSGAAVSEAGTEDLDATGQLQACEIGQDHFGFGARSLETKEKGNLTETNRDNMKPFAAIAATYQRMGLNEACLNRAEASFGSAPDRWFLKETTSVVIISALHTANFCAAEDWLQRTGMPQEVEVQTATQLCGQLIEGACMEKAEDYQLNACVDMVVNQTADEAIVSRRYAHGLAAVLTSACVITY
tara:strand:+ start:306 stop:899 length:594 start_codon:yes stop_codon:yes gene_type:complete